jgi:hypothetical protein
MSNHSTATNETFPLYSIKIQIKNFMDSKILPRQMTREATGEYGKIK